MLHSRIKRVQEEYQHELAKIIAYDLSDPRLEFVSVTGVKVSKDLREAVVHVSVLADAEERDREALEALESARGYLKRLLAERLSLKRLPDPHFVLDTSEREAFRLFGIMERLKEEAPVGEPDARGDGPEA